MTTTWRFYLLGFWFGGGPHHTSETRGHMLLRLHPWPSIPLQVRVGTSCDMTETDPHPQSWNLCRTLSLFLRNSCQEAPNGLFQRSRLEGVHSLTPNSQPASVKGRNKALGFRLGDKNSLRMPHFPSKCAPPCHLSSF